MTARAEQLAARRKALEERSERLRRELATDAEIVGDSTARAEHVVEAARRYTSPAMLLLAGAALVVAVASPARTVAWLTRGAMLLSVAKRSLGVYRQVRAQLTQLR